MSTPTASTSFHPARGRWLSVGRLMWLAYLMIYPVPWLDQPPTRSGLLASLAGTVLFLATYAHAYFLRPRSLLPDVLAMALIGFALSPFGGTWSVFDIFAIALAARLPSRRDALMLVTVLLLCLPAFGLVFGLPWFGWLSGLLFGVLAAAGTMFQFDLERRNAQLLDAQAEVRTLAASAERERISRDLHDLLGHTLTLVAIKADLAARLSLSAPNRARQEMEGVAQAARDALGEVRMAVAGMRDARLETELARAGRALAAAGIDVEYPAVPPVLAPDIEAVLGMVLREAITNVIRHADARSCHVGLLVETDGSVSLRVEDDGKGGPILEGSGLSGMRTRLEAAGGTMRIGTGRDGVSVGTVLLARLPRLHRPVGQPPLLQATPR